MLGCALQLQRLTAGEFVPGNERIGAAVPHWATTIKAKTGLTIESAGAVSRNWRGHERLLVSESSKPARP
jgi:hypothetical protein